MKSVSKFIFVGMILVLVFTPTASAEVVSFPDAFLEAEVRSWLSIPGPTAITDTDMETMTSFDATSSSISNIQGLDYGTNLILLELYDNLISDISALSGLTNLTTTRLDANHISDISAVSGLTNLAQLYLDYNEISDISAVSGLTNLYYLGLQNNQIATMDLSNSNLASLISFNILDNPLTSVLLTDATLSQEVFNVLMDGGGSYTGIAELGGVLDLDMSGVDFVDISDLTKMYTMDDLVELLLADASNLDGAAVVSLTGELDSMNYLDVTGLWSSFDVGTQTSLNSWAAIGGNTLIPEPATLSLLAIGGLALIRRRK